MRASIDEKNSRLSIVGKQALPIILGIETSCDDTAAALVTCDEAGRGRILSNITRGQSDLHDIYGGIVPEIAARAHTEILDGLIKQALADGNVNWRQIDAVAVTSGPGLIGGLLVGLSCARAIAYALRRPLIAINHLEGHALTGRLVEDVEFPFLLALMSGGHTQILRINGIGDYIRLGTTLDDALGESFDKLAHLLGLGHPGGPEIERQARDGDANRFDLPRPLYAKRGCDMSFAGLKSAVNRLVQKNFPLSTQDIKDICASFQAAICDVLDDKISRALADFAPALPPAKKRPSARSGSSPPCLVVAGGVASNQAVRSRLEKAACRHGFHLVAPPANLCTDNGAMIAWAAIERLRAGLGGQEPVMARSRWPLDEKAPPALGHGKRGVKV